MNRLLVGAVSVAVVAVAGGALLRGRRPEPVAVSVLREADTRMATQQFLLYFIVPLWLAAGFADWLCHRKTKIEKTTGAKETLIHLLMLGEMGVPVLAGLFLEINAAVLALMIGAFFVH